MKMNRYNTNLYCMGFECRICGTCCMYLGDYIAIDEQKGPYSFFCSCVSTGTGFLAEIDPDKRQFFDDYTFPNSNPSACRFLRPFGDGKIGCTIHTDSPAQCKYYRCRIMEIFSTDGKLQGYITGTLALHSEEISLKNIYDKGMLGVSRSDPDVEEQIKKFLLQAGYTTR